ncbi:MAG: lectin like domain-containing protein [Candidatus Omnitrophota bacterium]
MKRIIFFTVIVCVFVIQVFAINAPSTDETPKMSPLNPEFIKYQEAVKEGRYLTLISDGYPLGYVPSPVDLSNVKSISAPQNRGIVTAYPTTFDLRTQGKLTAIRDQGACGSCWTFATMASLESYLMPGQIKNFGEQDMNANHHFDYGECEGGNSWMSSAYLLRWDGPLSETDAPYPYSLSMGIEGYAPQKHVQQVVFLPPRANKLDNNAIKSFISTYGAVYCAFRYGDAYYNSSYKSYYYNGAFAPNHAVAIVGWDDSFAASKFNIAPPGNGAFILRNSWGTSWGESGYFYLSYYDNSFREVVSFNNAEATTNYQKVYQYDPLGWVSNYGYGDTIGWAANIFTTEGASQLKAVGFYVTDINVQYTIYIYRGVTAGAPRSGTLITTQSGSKTYPGYYTIALNTPVSLTNGQKFSVVVKCTNASYTYPVAIEYPIASYSSAATANSGESFCSHNGSTWEDVGTLYDANPCIKAYVGLNGSNITVTSPNGGETWYVGSSHPITWSSYNVIGNVKIEYTRDNGNTWTSVNASASNTGSYSWVIPNAPATQCKVRVTSLSNGSLLDVSNAVFSIVRPSITVTSPNGGEQWYVGTTHPITWTSGGVSGNVKIEYSRNNGSTWILINASTANTGSYSWVVPNAPATQCKVRVTSVSNGTILDTSNAVFSILRPTITVTSPNGGESWVVGTTHSITWTSVGLTGYVKIEYTKDNGTTWIIVSASRSNSGSHSWLVPNTVSSLCKIRISSVSISGASDTSNSVFTIRRL